MAIKAESGVILRVTKRDLTLILEALDSLCTGCEDCTGDCSRNDLLCSPAIKSCEIKSLILKILMCRDGVTDEKVNNPDRLG
jgi:hypothetical protein